MSARPNKTTMTNALNAVIAAGLIPGAINIAADGAIKIDVVHENWGPVQPATVSNLETPEKFEDLL